MFYCVNSVWFGSEWFGVILLRSGSVWVVSFLVWFGVFWCGFVWFVYFLVVINVFWCDLVSFGVVWCDFAFLSCNGCFLASFGCDLLLCDLMWYYWVQVRSQLVCFCYCLVSLGVVWCDFYICCGNRCFIVWFGSDLILII